MTDSLLKSKPSTAACMSQEPLVMGILNVTPDSFFSGSRKMEMADIAARAREIVAQGGTIIDVGACSTRPGGIPVDGDEELRRLRMALPVVREVCPGVKVSVDTFRTDIARICIDDYGVEIINDVSEGNTDMFRLVGSKGVGYVLMSVAPDIEGMTRMFGENIQRLRDCGCTDIILDPGYGFGKTVEENYAVLRRQKSC